MTEAAEMEAGEASADAGEAEAGGELLEEGEPPLDGIPPSSRGGSPTPSPRPGSSVGAGECGSPAPRGGSATPEPLSSEEGMTNCTAFDGDRFWTSCGLAIILGDVVTDLWEG